MWRKFSESNFTFLMAKNNFMVNVIINGNIESPNLNSQTSHEMEAKVKRHVRLLFQQPTAQVLLASQVQAANLLMSISKVEPSEIKSFKFCSVRKPVHLLHANSIQKTIRRYKENLIPELKEKLRKERFVKRTSKTQSRRPLRSPRVWEWTVVQHSFTWFGRPW